MEEVNWILKAQRAGTNEASLAASNISIAQSLASLVDIAMKMLPSPVLYKPVPLDPLRDPVGEAYILGVPLDKILNHPGFDIVLNEIREGMSSEPYPPRCTNCNNFHWPDQRHAILPGENRA